MISFNEKLIALVTRDGRYAYEAYEFVFHALHFAQQHLGRLPGAGLSDAEAAAEPRHHVSGKELLEAIRILAQREFGFLARTVLHQWGIDATDDFGAIVFNLVEAELMSKTEHDCRQDFHDVYDLDQALLEGFHIPLDETH